MLGELFKSKSREIDVFAQDLSAALAPRLLPQARPSVESPVLAGLIDEVEERAVAFSRQHRLGIYGKARLCRTLGECLAEAGADTTASQTIVRRYLGRIARAKA